MFSGCTGAPDSKETNLGSSNQEGSPSAGKNTAVGFFLYNETHLQYKPPKHKMKEEFTDLTQYKTRYQNPYLRPEECKGNNNKQINFCYKKIIIKQNKKGDKFILILENYSYINHIFNCCIQ